MDYVKFTQFYFEKNLSIESVDGIQGVVSKVFMEDSDFKKKIQKYPGSLEQCLDIYQPLGSQTNHDNDEPGVSVYNPLEESYTFIPYFEISSINELMV